MKLSKAKQRLTENASERHPLLRFGDLKTNCGTNLKLSVSQIIERWKLPRACVELPETPRSVVNLVLLQLRLSDRVSFWNDSQPIPRADTNDREQPRSKRTEADPSEEWLRVNHQQLNQNWTLTTMTVCTSCSKNVLAQNNSKAYNSHNVVEPTSRSVRWPNERWTVLMAWLRIMHNTNDCTNCVLSCALIRPQLDVCAIFVWICNAPPSELAWH